ncbi:MAG: hypothetical protein FJZ76_04375 [Bacteroidetes bacterium]|nr:hypothetical protein [Bacteroidota bacterium]
MKKQLLLLVALVFAATTWTQAQTILDFKLVNNTGEDFYGVYLTETTTLNWGEDILPQDIVEDGDVVSITFEYVDDETICIWDLRLTHDESEEYWIYIEEIDLCEVSILTLYIDEDGDYAFKVE